MTNKEIEWAHAWCKLKLGYVPSEKEWLEAAKNEPGLVSLYMKVINKQFNSRSERREEEKYSYEVEPSSKGKIEAGVWYGKAKKRP